MGEEEEITEEVGLTTGGIREEVEEEAVEAGEGVEEATEGTTMVGISTEVQEATTMTGKSLWSCSRGIRELQDRNWTLSKTRSSREEPAIPAKPVRRLQPASTRGGLPSL